MLALLCLWATWLTTIGAGNNLLGGFLEVALLETFVFLLRAAALVSQINALNVLDSFTSFSATNRLITLLNLLGVLCFGVNTLSRWWPWLVLSRLLGSSVLKMLLHLLEHLLRAQSFSNLWSDISLPSINKPLYTSP
jgi:hypothetical protein